MRLASDLPEVRRVVAVLQEVHRRELRVRLLSAGLLWVTLLCLDLLFAAFVGYLDPPALVKRLGKVLVIAAPVVSGCAFLLAAFRRDSLERVAWRVEHKVGGLNNALVNALQLARDWRFWPDRTLWRLVVREASRAAGLVVPAHVVETRPLVRSGFAAFFSMLLLCTAVLAWPAEFRYGLVSLWRPQAVLPRSGAVPIREVRPGSVSVVVGEPLVITAVVDNEQGRQLEARLVVLSGRQRQSLRMHAAAGGFRVFEYRFAAVLQPFQYYIEVGDSRSEVYTVSVRPYVRLRRMEHVYHYPAYTGLGTRTVPNPSGPIRVPVGTVVEVNIEVVEPVPQVLLEFADGRRLAMEQVARCRYAAKMAVKSADRYAIVFASAEGRPVARLPMRAGQEALVKLNGLRLSAGDGSFWPIVAVPDLPPRVRLIEPVAEISAALGQSVPVVVSARDDYGLSGLKVLARLADAGQADRRELASRNSFSDRRNARLTCRLILDPQRYVVGQVIEVWAEATDNRSLPDGLGPQTGRSNVARIRIVEQGPEGRSRDVVAALRERLWEILRLQIEVKAQTDAVKHLSRLEPAKSRAEALR